MKLKNKSRKIVKAGFVFGALLMCAFFTNADAQTTRRTTSTNTTTKPAPTPTKAVPEIISLADDFATGNQIILQPVETPPKENLPERQPENTQDRIDQVLLNRLENTEAATKDEKYDQKQRRLLLNLDILSRAEQRADSLRKQLFDLIERENQIRSKLDQIENDIRPEMIDRVIAFAGTLRPEQLREQRRRHLQSEKSNLENLLNEITNNKSNLQENVQKADSLVERLRLKLEKDIDDALNDDLEDMP
jgi:hypothetical protein